MPRVLVWSWVFPDYRLPACRVPNEISIKCGVPLIKVPKYHSVLSYLSKNSFSNNTKYLIGIWRNLTTSPKQDKIKRLLPVYFPSDQFVKYLGGGRQSIWLSIQFPRTGQWHLTGDLFFASASLPFLFLLRQGLSTWPWQCWNSEVHLLPECWG